MSLDEHIVRLGLSKRAATIYRACLEHGPESISAIARFSNERRSTARYTIEGLLKKGLLQLSRRGRRTFYDAQRPGKLLTLLHEQERELKDLLPKLEALRSQKEPLTQVSIQEDMENVRALYAEIYEYLDAPGGVSFLASMRDIEKYAPFALEMHLHILCSRERYSVRELVLDDAEGRRWIRLLRSRGLRHPCRLLPPPLAIANDFALFGTHVGLFSFQKRLSAVVIDDPRIAGTLRALYEIAWAQGIEG
jgi:DNA-binding MarR family transcriptional regulator